MTSFYINYLFKDPSPNRHILRSWGLGHQHLNCGAGVQGRPQHSPTQALPLAMKPGNSPRAHQQGTGGNIRYVGLWAYQAVTYKEMETHAY